MGDTGKKGPFNWQEGETLDDDNVAPLGDIRAYGLPKINKALAKDPVARKREREKFLADEQSRPYKSDDVKKRENVIVEAPGDSNLSGKFEDSEVKRLTGKGNARSHGLFGKK